MVEVVFEKKATPEQVQKARKLQLPDNFYLYEDAPPCPGCQGCCEEEEETVVSIAVMQKCIIRQTSWNV